MLGPLSRKLQVSSRPWLIRSRNRAEWEPSLTYRPPNRPRPGRNPNPGLRSCGSSPPVTPGRRPRPHALQCVCTETIGSKQLAPPHAPEPRRRACAKHALQSTLMPIRTRDELIESEAIHTLAFTAPSRARCMPLSCQTEPHIGHSAPLYLAHSRAARDRVAPMSNVPHHAHPEIPTLHVR